MRTASLLVIAFLVMCMSMTASAQTERTEGSQKPETEKDYDLARIERICKTVAKIVRTNDVIGITKHLNDKDPWVRAYLWFHLQGCSNAFDIFTINMSVKQLAPIKPKYDPFEDAASVNEKVTELVKLLEMHKDRITYAYDKYSGAELDKLYAQSLSEKKLSGFLVGIAFDNISREAGIRSVYLLKTLLDHREIVIQRRALLSLMTRTAPHLYPDGDSAKRRAFHKNLKEPAVLQKATKKWLDWWDKNKATIKLKKGRPGFNRGWQ